MRCEMLAELIALIVLQVLYDIASGIGNAAKMDIAHRDITPPQFWTLEKSGLPLRFLSCEGVQHI